MSAETFEEHVRGKWFEPITEKLEAFENELNEFGQIEAITEPDSPDWALNCAVKAMKPYGDLTGLPFDGEFGARHVGAMVGTKSSVCAAMAASHKIAKLWPAKSRQRFVEVFGLDDVIEAEKTWKRFADKHHPKFEEIRLFAAKLAMQQNYFEDVHFVQGLAKGLTFMDELRKSLRKTATKAQKDAQKRAAVYFFAVSVADTIEINRAELSWPLLSGAFNEAFDYKVSVDEETFKKILQRCGLRVGKPGRRTEVSI